MPLGSQATKDHNAEKDSAQKSRSKGFSREGREYETALSATAESLVGQVGKDQLGEKSVYVDRLKDKAQRSKILVRGPSKEANEAGKQLDEINYARAMNQIKKRRG